jgi:hypothetical protein
MMWVTHTRARALSVVAPTQRQRNILIEGIENVGQEIHPSTLRFGNRLVAQPRSPPTGDDDIVMGSDPH